MATPEKNADISDYKLHDPEVDGQLITHNVWVDGHRTSVRLEGVMWQALHEITEREGLSIHQVMTIISRRQHPNASFTATVRAFLVAYYRAVNAGADRLLSVEAASVGIAAGLGGTDALHSGVAGGGGLSQAMVRPKVKDLVPSVADSDAAWDRLQALMQRGLDLGGARFDRDSLYRGQ